MSILHLPEGFLKFLVLHHISTNKLPAVAKLR